MNKVISAQAAAVAAVLQAKGYSKENPFIPSEKTDIRLLIELPLKYQYEYPHEVEAAWPEKGRLFVRAYHIVEGESVLFSGEILDDELTDADYEKESFGTYMGAEISYWLLDDLLQKFFSITPFGRPSKPFEADFYSIEKRDDEKVIHINGTLWKSDDEWRHSEYVFLIVPLSEFISRYAQSGENASEYIDELLQGAKTGIGELTEKEAVTMISRYVKPHMTKVTCFLMPRAYALGSA